MNNEIALNLGSQLVGCTIFDRAVISIVLKLYRGYKLDYINKFRVQGMESNITDEDEKRRILKVEYDVVSE
jgi:hypothetical protein